MNIGINNQQGILQARDTDPAFREAVRRHLLTGDLINLPEKFAAFVTSQQAFNQDLRNDLHRIAGNIGDLKGNAAGRAAWDRHEDILAQLDFTLVRMFSKADLNNLANQSDTTGIHRSDLLSFYRAGPVMEALDHDNNTHYVAMEASSTADARDTDRVTRNAGFLTRFTGQPAHAVIASRQNDRAVQRLVENNTMHWFHSRPPTYNLISSLQRPRYMLPAEIRRQTDRTTPLYHPHAHPGYAPQPDGRPGSRTPST
jgi:hypothetical protein